LIRGLEPLNPGDDRFVVIDHRHGRIGEADQLGSLRVEDLLLLKGANTRVAPFAGRVGRIGPVTFSFLYDRGSVAATVQEIQAALRPGDQPAR
jgi:hypothetical protein